MIAVIPGSFYHPIVGWSREKGFSVAEPVGFLRLPSRGFSPGVRSFLARDAIEMEMPSSYAYLFPSTSRGGRLYMLIRSSGVPPCHPLHQRVFQGSGHVYFLVSLSRGCADRVFQAS